MEADADFIRDALSGARQHSVLSPASWVARNGKFEAPIENVVAEYAIPLLKGRELWTHGISWNHLRTDPSTFEYVYFLLYMILCMEDLELGAPNIKFNKAENPARYNAVVEALARLYCNRSKQHDMALIKRHTEGAAFFNVETQKEIRAAMERIIEQEKKEKAAKRKRPAENEEEEEEEGVLDLEARAQNVEEEDFFGLLPRLCVVNLHVTEEALQEPEALGALAGENLPTLELSAEELRPYGSSLFVYYQTQRVAAAARAEQAGEEDEALDQWMQDNPDLLDETLLNVLARRNLNIVPKAVFTITAIPYTERGANHDPHHVNVMGYLVRIFQLDSTWNPGHLRAKLEEASQKRTLLGSSRNYRDPYAQYAHFMGTQHPVFNNSRNAYIDMALKILKKPVDMDQWSEWSSSGTVGNYASELHVRNMLTLPNALKIFREAGAPAHLMDPSLFVSADGRAAMTPVQLRGRSYRYMSDQVFWTHDLHVGLSEQYFPDYMPNVTRAESEEALNMMQAELDELYDMCASRPIMHRSAIIERIPRSMPFHTSDAFVHLACEADHYEKLLSALMPKNALELLERAQHKQRISARDAKAYADYAKGVRAMQEKFMRELENIFMADENSVDYLPVSKPVRAIIKWFFIQRKNNPRLKNGVVTRALELFDPELSFMGNALAMEMLMVEKIGRVAQPSVSMLTKGVLSVYQRRKEQLLYNLMVPGIHDTGKSYAVTTFVMKVLCIMGTWMKEDRTTRSADNTDAHIMDLIRVRDEFSDWIVNRKAEARHEDEVNQKKTALTSGLVVLKTFEFCNVPGRGELRGARYVTTAQNYVEVGCTNKPTENTELLSRYNVVTMKISSVPVNMYNFPVTREEKAHMLHYFHVNQYLSCIAYKAMMIGAMTREINPQPWNDVTAKMLEALNAWRGFSDSGARALEKIKPFGEQLILERAAHLTWDVVGAKYYQQPFHPTQLWEMQRYLYWTEDIIVYTITARSNVFVDEDAHTIWRAIYDMTGLPHDSQLSNYEIYSRDMENRIPWLTYDNEQYVKQFKPPSAPNRDTNAKPEVDPRIHDLTGSYYKTLVDLNYVHFPGHTLSQVAVKLAPFTHPKMAAKDIEAKLEEKAHEFYVPRMGARNRNGYGPVGEEWLKQHKVTKDEKLEWGPQDLNTGADGEFIRHVGMRRAFVVLRDLQDVTEDQVDSVKKQETLLNIIFNATAYEKVAALSLIPSAERALLTTQTARAATDELYAAPLSALSDEEIELTWNALYLIQDFNIHNVSDKRRCLESITGFNCVRARLLIHGTETGEIRAKGTPSHYYRRPVLDTTTEICQGGRAGCEDDVPQVRDRVMPVDGSVVSEHHSIPVVNKNVKVTRGNKRSVAIAINAIEQYDREMLLQALIYAIVCHSTTPGKKLLGWVEDSDMTKYRTLEMRAEDIRAYIARYEERADDTVVSRMQGVAFKRLGSVNERAARFLQTNVVRAEKLSVISNLDYHAAAMQHVACGFPLDEPVHDPAYVHARYVEAGGKVGDFCYPDEFLREVETIKTQTWGANTTEQDAYARQNSQRFLNGVRARRAARESLKHTSSMSDIHVSFDPELSRF